MIQLDDDALRVRKAMAPDVPPYHRYDLLGLLSWYLYDSQHEFPIYGDLDKFISNMEKYKNKILS